MAMATLFQAIEMKVRITLTGKFMEDDSTETLLSESKTNALDYNQRDHQQAEQLSIIIDCPRSYSQTVECGRPPPFLKWIANLLITPFLDDKTSIAPLFYKFLFTHECVIVLSGGLYWLQPNIGAIWLSIVPSLNIMGLFIYFLLNRFDPDKTRHIFRSAKHYFVAFSLFVIGACSIILIYRSNTYLASMLPRKMKEEAPIVHQWITNILKFPYNHSKMLRDPEKKRPFNLRMCFVGSIIAPMVEETFKFGLVCLTLPIPFLWRFYRNQFNFDERAKSSTTTSIKTRRSTEYQIESLFIMFTAICGSCGLAMMENIGYLAACQWKSTFAYCLPKENQDILGAGLTRGIFSVPFHSVTAAIMSDVLCVWIHSQRFAFFQQSRLHLVFKFVMSYPVSIAIPVVLHSNFNYWTKGWPFMTGIITITGFVILITRIGHRFWIINDAKNKQESSTTEVEPAREIQYGNTTVG